MIWDNHSPKLTDELRNVLVGFSVFQTSEERQRVVSALPFASDIEYHPAPIRHVEEIVRVCARNLTGFDALLEALERFETEPLDPVYETLDRFLAEYASLITFSELRQLKLIVDPPNRDLVSDIIAAEAYKRACPLIPMQGRIQHGRRFVRALELLAKLSHFAPVQGPLFAFLEGCRPCLELPGVREPLVVWEEEVANRLKLDLVTIRTTVRTKAAGAAPTVLRLAPAIEGTVESEKRKQEEKMSRKLLAFLCHSTQDKMAVRVLYGRLIGDGFSAWLDEEDLIPGQGWDTEIRKAVRLSDVVIVCLSQSSITKEGYVQKEIRYALDVAEEKPPGSIFLIPTRLDECNVPERLKDVHWVDLFKDQGYEKLLKALRKRSEELGVVAATPL